MKSNGKSKIWSFFWRSRAGEGDRFRREKEADLKRFEPGRFMFRKNILYEFYSHCMFVHFPTKKHGF